MTTGMKIIRATEMIKIFTRHLKINNGLYIGFSSQIETYLIKINNTHIAQFLQVNPQ
jgi:hypothetical protein